MMPELSVAEMCALSLSPSITADSDALGDKDLEGVEEDVGTVCGVRQANGWYSARVSYEQRECTAKPLKPALVLAEGPDRVYTPNGATTSLRGR